jgi:uncharacterized lipoprotein YmbA
MLHKVTIIRLLAPVLLIPLLQGCIGRASPEPTFYHLSAAVPGKGQAAEASMLPEDSLLVVEIGPVTLPEYLQRPQIVTRSGGSELRIDKFHRWVGSLEDQIERVVAQSVEQFSDQVRAVGHRQQTVDPALIIELDIDDFTGTPGGDLLLRANWFVSELRNEGEIHHVRRSVIRVSVEGDGYPALVAAHDAALQRLSEEIAAFIRQDARPASPPLD